MSKDLINDITDWLCSLGTTPESIAASLESIGAKGNASEPESCVIANTIKNKWGDASIVDYQVTGSLAPTDIYEHSQRPRKSGTIEIDVHHGVITEADLSNKDALLAFLEAFDAGKYPNLRSDIYGYD